MLSYLHGFHAGNAADVLKHSALVFCLEYLKMKKKPLLCVDTHAGAGFYDLSEAADPLNREWKNGIGHILEKHYAQFNVSPSAGGEADKTPAMIASYVKLIGTYMNSNGDFISDRSSSFTNSGYPGSPVIMAGILEKGDRLVCFELHPRENEKLKYSMAGFGENREKTPTIELRREDGPKGLKSLLPPPSRRGLILIDPSWEEEEEYEIIPQILQAQLKRFPEGTFIVWYPLLARPKLKSGVQAPIGDVLFDIFKGKRCRAELCTTDPYTAAGSDRLKVIEHGKVMERGSPPGTAGQVKRGMYGSGLVIVNPPWTLRIALEETLPWLVKTLGEKGASSRLDWCE